LEDYLKFYDKIKKTILPVASKNIVAEFNSAINYFEKRGDDRYAGASHYYLGKHYYDQRMYGDAFYHQVQARKLFNKVGLRNIPDIGKFLHLMALNYYHFGYYKEVVQLMLASIKLPAFNENMSIQRYNTLGLAYRQLDQLDSAAYYFKRTQQVAASLHDTNWVYIATGNLGSTLMKRGQYEQAIPLLMQDYEYSQYLDRHPLMARNAALSIAQAWQKLNRQDNALHYLSESRRMNSLIRDKNRMWKEQSDEQYKLTHYEVLHDYYKNKGKSRMAYLYLDSLTCLRNETNLRYNKMTNKLAEDRLTIEQQLTNLAVQEVEKKKIKWRLQLIIGIVGMLAAIISMLYYMLRLKQAKDNLLAEKDRALRQLAQERIEARLAEAHVELNEYMLRLEEKKNLVQIFQSEIDQIRTTTIGQSSQLDELKSRLVNMKLLTLDDWNDFRQRFNQAFGGLLDQLKMQYGNITHAEERIYALEKLNVSTNQMAWMLGISPESVRKTRYRLRKKIGNDK
jgi:hypothetical protein